MNSNESLISFSSHLQEPGNVSDDNFIQVKSHADDEEAFELPIERSGLLPLSTLHSAFPHATGLKYRNPVTGASRPVLLDESRRNFLTPAGGWGNKAFIVITPPASSIPSHSNGRLSQNSLLSSLNSSDCPNKGRGDVCAGPPPGFESCSTSSLQPSTNVFFIPPHLSPNMNSSISTPLDDITKKLKNIPKFNSDLSLSTFYSSTTGNNSDDNFYEPEFDDIPKNIKKSSNKLVENIPVFVLSNDTIQNFKRILEHRSARIKEFFNSINSQQNVEFKTSPMVLAIQFMHKKHPNGCTPEEFVEFEHSIKIGKNGLCTFENCFRPPLSSLLDTDVLWINDNRICVDKKYLDVHLFCLPRNLASNFYRVLKLREGSMNLMDALPILPKVVSASTPTPLIEDLVKLCNKFPHIFEIDSESGKVHESKIKLNENLNPFEWRIVLDCESSIIEGY